MTLRYTEVAKTPTLDERAVFLDRLRVVEARSLLTIGLGPDSSFFARAGLDVTAVDDATALPSGPFDGVFAVDVSGDEAWPAIRSVLQPGGLLFVSASTDLVGPLARIFEVIDFHTVEVGGRRFRSATLVRPLDG